MSASEDDCLGCRLTSAGGLFAAGYYIYRQSLNKTALNRFGMLSISTAFGLVGIARLLNLIPQRKQQTRTNNEEDS